jgi:hypothetical protein
MAVETSASIAFDRSILTRLIRERSNSSPQSCTPRCYDYRQMPFRTISARSISSTEASAGFEIFFSPAPDEACLPTVWLDLHICGDSYQNCENSVPHEFVEDTQNKERYLLLRPHRGVRLFTHEHVGVDRNHTAIVVNAASQAKHGLIVAPGKVDPGFRPNRLVLVVYNQSNRTIRLRSGAKVACIAFAHLQEPAKPTDSQGHSLAGLPQFAPGFFHRVRSWLSSSDSSSMLEKIIGWTLAAVAGGLIQRFMSK